MLYFLGNCQMDFLSRAMADRGFDVAYRVLASPLTYTSHPGEVPPGLYHLVHDMKLKDFFHDRLPENQYQMITPKDAPPSLIVMNLFHENTPLFVHNRDRYIFFMDPAAWQDNPKLEAWLNAECGMIQPNPATYLKRYGQFLELVRGRFPGVPIVVVSRLSHFPAFGPNPYSYLEEWGKLSREAPAHYRVWQRGLDKVHVVDMDRVFGGIWAESGQRIETHCPFLKITLEETDGVITGLHASRDMEHIGSMWPKMAGKLAEFMETGEIGYAADEAVPEEWNRPWQPSRMNEDTMLQKLASTGNYPWAEAVGAFFMDLQTDYTPLLAGTGHLMPVCHNTLHMIKNYGHITKNPILAKWCDAHRKTAEQFTDNGPLYRKDYLRRIDEIKASVRG